MSNIISYFSRVNGFCKKGDTLQECDFFDALDSCQRDFDKSFNKVNALSLFAELNYNSVDIYNHYNRFFVFSKNFNEKYNFNSWCEDNEVLILNEIKAHSTMLYSFISHDKIYRGTDTLFTKGNSIIIADIDDVLAHELAVAHFSELCRDVPNLIAVFPSFSGKLHCALYIDEVEVPKSIKDAGFDSFTLSEASGETYMEVFRSAYAVNVLNLAEKMYEICNYNLFEISGAIDFSNALASQGIGLNYMDESQVKINREYAANNDIIKNIEYYKKKYAALWTEKTKKKSVAAGFVDLNVFDKSLIINNGELIKIDKNFNIGKDCGNDARYKVVYTLLYMYGYDTAREIIENRFEDETSRQMLASLESAKNKDVQSAGMLYVDFCSQFVEQNKYDEIIQMGDNDYLSKYRQYILSKIQFGQSVYIEAGCGVGKSFFFNSLLKENIKVCIISHLKSIRDSVYNEHSNYILDSAKVSEIVSNKAYSVLGDKLVINWESYAKFMSDEVFRNKLSDYIKCFDEAHNFVNAWSYRAETIAQIAPYFTDKTIYCSATPLGEERIIGNVYKIKFDKPVKKQINYHLLMPFGLDLNNLNKNQFKDIDTLSTIIKLVKEINDSNQYSCVSVFDNINHLKIAEHYGDTCIHFSREIKDNADKTRINDSDALQFVESKQSMSDEEKARYRANLALYRRSAVDELMIDESVKKPVFITTTAGVEGINIKNNYDKVAVVLTLNGCTTNDCIQFLNRWRNVKNIDVYFVIDKNHLMIENVYGWEDNVNKIKDTVVRQRLTEELMHESYLLTNNLYIKNYKINESNYSVLYKLCIAAHNMRLKNTITINSVFRQFESVKTVQYNYVQSSSIGGVRSSLNVSNDVLWIANDIELMTNSRQYMTSDGNRWVSFINRIETGSGNDKHKVYVAKKRSEIKTALGVLVDRVSEDDVKYIYEVANDVCTVLNSCRKYKYVKNGFPIDKVVENDSVDETVANTLIKMFSYTSVKDGSKRVNVKWSLMADWIKRRDKLMMDNVSNGVYLKGVDKDEMIKKVESVWDRRAVDIDDKFDKCLVEYKDDLVKWTLNDMDVDEKGRCKKYKVNESKSRNRSVEKFCLISDESIKFKTKKDAFEWLVKNGLVKCGFKNFVDRASKNWIKRV